jgi:hypothetical protein
MSNEANTHTAGKGYMNGISRLTITLQMSINEVMSDRSQLWVQTINSCSIPFKTNLFQEF